MLKSEEFEVKDQAHQMYAEGCHDNKPLESDILAAVGLSGYQASSIEISYDDFQEVWRWTCDIQKSQA